MVLSAIKLVHINAEKALEVIETLIGFVEARNPYATPHKLSKSKADDPDHQQFQRFHQQSSGGGGGGGVGDRLIPAELLGPAQLPYLYDLRNSYSFFDSCLESEADEVRIVHQAMDNISQIRANNTALVLSLIATIFLPATFFTGVFGMNFQEDGGYTIGLVNSPYGPHVFYIICILVLFLNIAYFFSMGWLDMVEVSRYFLKLFCGKSFANKFLEDPSMLYAFDDDDGDERDAGNGNRSKSVSKGGAASGGGRDPSTSTRRNISGREFKRATSNTGSNAGANAGVNAGGVGAGPADVGEDSFVSMEGDSSRLSVHMRPMGDAGADEGSTSPTSPHRRSNPGLAGRASHAGGSSRLSAIGRGSFVAAGGGGRGAEPGWATDLLSRRGGTAVQQALEEEQRRQVEAQAKRQRAQEAQYRGRPSMI